MMRDSARAATRRLRLGLRQRIALSAATLVLFVLVTSALGFWYVRTSAGTLDASQEGVQQISRLATLESSWNGVSSTIDRMLLTRQSSIIEEELTASLAGFDETLGTLSDHSFGARPGTIASHAQIVADLQLLGEELDGAVDEIQAAAAQGRWAEAEVLRQTDLATLQGRFELRLQELRHTTSAEIDALVVQSATRQRAAGIALSIGLGIAVLLGVAFTFAGVRGIVDPINELIERTRRISEGDFTYVAALDRDDEIGILSSSFSIMTEWLADSYQVLEERVDERTRDLALASEVGRRLTRLRDMDSLLNEAVELIRNRFNLYYTQVYLVSEDERSLVLRAGTGVIGEELLSRGFKLPIDRGSINGYAAHDRRPVIISNTEQSGRFRPNALLPDTKSEIAMPLLAGTRIVGVLDLQSDRRYGLSEENLAAFEVLAGQLAIAIENALLFSENRAARAELEGHAQTRIVESWQAYLNAIERPERLVYSYAAGAVHAESKGEILEAVGDNSLSAAIELNNVRIGRIRLKAQPQQRWTQQDLEVVEDVARLVAQQVENLRLLADAERYREEAERALQRLTQKSWKEMSAAVSAYHYDGRQVVAQEKDAGLYELARPLLVGGEPVGELRVETKGKVAEEEAAELASAVGARLSAHLEHLRLSKQTETALADVQRRSEELEDLNRIVTRIAGTLDLRNSLQIVVEELVMLTAADQARIGLLNGDRSALTIVSEEFDESRAPSALGLAIPVEGNALTQEVLSTRSTVVIRDAQSHPLTTPIRGMLREQGIRTMIVLPIMAGNEVIGTVGADILTEGVDFSASDLRLAETVVFQAATTIQNARLFEQIQTTLAETRELYRASAELNRARTYDDLLDVLRQHTVAGDGSTSLSLALFDTPWTDASPPKWIDILAHWSAQPVKEPMLRFSLDDYPALGIMEREGQTLISDVDDDPRLDTRSRRLLQRAFKARAVLAAPLIAGGQWIGHVNALFPETRDFSEADLQQLQNLVGQVAVAVQSINLLNETSRLLESEQRQRRISDALVRATNRMLGVLDEQRIRQLMVEEVENLLGPDQITLYHWLADEDVLEVEKRRLVRGAAHDDYSEGQSLSKEQRPELWRALSQGKSMLRQLEGSDEVVQEHFIVPWQVGTEVAGVVEMYHTTRGAAIRQEDQASIEGIVQQAAIRLQSARLFKEAELRTAETDALYRASRTINTATTYREILEAVREHTVLGADAGMVSLNYFDRPWTDEAPEWVEVLARWSSGRGASANTRYALQTFSAAPTVLKQDDVTVVEDIATDQRLDDASRALLREHMDTRSALFIPLRAGGQWLGFIEAHFLEAQRFSDEAVRRLQALASQAAATVQGLHLLREAQVRAQRERVLREITARIRSATDMDVIMKTAVREVSHALGRDAFVMLGEQLQPDKNVSAKNGSERRQTD